MSNDATGSAYAAAMTAATRREVAVARAAAHDVPEAVPDLRVDPEAEVNARLTGVARTDFFTTEIAAPADWARATARARLTATTRAVAQAEQDAVTERVTTCMCRAHARAKLEPEAEACFEVVDQAAARPRTDPVAAVDFFAWAAEVATPRDAALEVAALTATPDVDGTPEQDAVTYRMAAEDCQAHARPYDRPDAGADFAATLQAVGAKRETAVAAACLAGEAEDDGRPNPLAVADAALRAEPDAAPRPRTEPRAGMFFAAVLRPFATA